MTGNATYKRDQVVGIINSMLGKIQKPQEVSHEALGRELTELKSIIENLRSQLHATQAADIGNTHIPAATDELDAVVGTTEQATQSIMDSCEKVLEIMKGEKPETFQQVEACVVKIFEACTFQDITGQRIKKVVTCLKQIEAKTSSVLKVLEGELGEIQGKAGDNSSSTVVSLLNGPSLPQNAVTQDDIDKLLAEFDGKNT